MATRPISRRDFLKGAGIAVGGSALIGLGPDLLILVSRRQLI